MNIYLVTNGTLLMKTDINIIKKIKNIQISLEGLEQINDLLRGVGTFKSILQNIDFLDKNGFIEKVRIRCTINKLNMQEIKKIINFCIDRKIQFLSFGIIRNQGRTIDKWKELQLSSDEIYKLKFDIDNYRNLYKEILEIGIFDVDGGNCGIVSNDFIIDLRVDVQGNFYLCHGFVEKKWSIGNIKNQSCYSIFYGSKINELRYKLINRVNNLDQCKKCYWKKMFCMGGCPAEAYNINNDINSLDGKCQERIAFWTSKLKIK